MVRAGDEEIVDVLEGYLKKFYDEIIGFICYRFQSFVMKKKI
jgi:hypothetical protein